MSKNSALIRVGKQQYAAGMRWETVEDGYPEGPAKYAEHAGATHYAALKSDDGSDQIGLVDADANPELAGKNISALAGMLAQQRNGVLVAFRVQNDKTQQFVYWIAAISEVGYILPNSDTVVGTAEEAEEDIRLACEISAEEGLSLLVSEDLAESLSDLDPGITTLEDLFGSRKPSKIKLQRAKSNTKTVFVAGFMGLVLVAIVGGIVVWLNREPPPPPQEVGLSPEELRQLRIDQYNKLALEKVNKILPTESDFEWVTRVRDASFAMKILSEGYLLTGFECDVSGLCSYEFDKEGNAYLQAFEERYAGIAVGEVRFSLDGENAEFSRQFAIDSSVEDRGPAFIKGAPDAQTYYKRLIERFHALENAGVLGWTRVATQPRAIAGLTPPEASFRPLWTGSMSIQLTEMWLLETMLELLDNPYTAITKITVAINENPSINLEVNYVVAN